jgi:PKD repeat protein
MGGNITIGADSTVYVNNENGTVYAFTADLQQLLWQYSTPLNAFGNCILAKEGTMVLTAAGTSITAFAPVLDRKPVADFRVSSRKVLTGQPLGFQDQSSFEPTAWQWSFPGANIGSSADPNPGGIVYASPGVYSVSLVASNSHGADSLARQCYIEVELNTSAGVMVDAGQVSVYPNPFAGGFSMEATRQLQGERFQVMNSQGQLVREGVAGEGATRVELRGCADGIYFLRVGGRVYKLAKQG